jgi:high affinity sulfate transporter 1
MKPWPVLPWVPGYKRSWLSADLFAGLTVCAILVPEGMAYAQLAGVPPEYAFYAAPVALVAYAVLGTSRQLVVAVSSAVAIMSAATISQLAVAGTPDYIALTAALAILAGLVSVLAGLLKLGRIAQFFSESVLLGFVFGLALLITVKQLPKILGIEAHGDTAVDVVIDLVPQLGQTDLATLAVGLVCIAAMVLLERRLPKVPAALVVLLASIAGSLALGLEAAGVAVVGPLPAGLAGPSLPGVGLSAVPELMAGALGIALVAFAEAIGPADQFAREHGARIDPNRELVALGAANTSAGLFSGFPIGASLSKSAANDRAGAHTPASLLTAAGATALVALFLTPLFAPLPEATLGAIVVVAVSGMMKVGKMRGLWRLRRADFWLAVVALAGVLVMPTLPALGLAVVVSLGMLIWRASQPRLTYLGRERGDLSPADVDATPDASVPGLLCVRPDEMLFFANVTSVRHAIVARLDATEPKPRVVLLDLSLTPDADAPVVEALADLRERLAGEGIELWLSHVRPDVRDLLDRSGLVAAIGADHVFVRTLHGIVAFRLRDEHDGRLAEDLDALRDLLEREAARPGTDPEILDLLQAFRRRVLLVAEAAGEQPAGPSQPAPGGLRPHEPPAGPPGEAP